MYLFPQLDIHSMKAVLFFSVCIFANLMNHMWDDISNSENLLLCILGTIYNKFWVI